MIRLDRNIINAIEQADVKEYGQDIDNGYIRIDDLFSLDEIELVYLCRLLEEIEGDDKTWVL